MNKQIVSWKSKGVMYEEFCSKTHRKTVSPTSQAALSQRTVDLCEQKWVMLTYPPKACRNCQEFPSKKKRVFPMCVNL